MISFERLWKTMQNKGVSCYQLNLKYGFDSKTIRRLRQNRNIETKTMDRLCAALDCRLEEVAEYIRD